MTISQVTPFQQLLRQQEDETRIDKLFEQIRREHPNWTEDDMVEFEQEKQKAKNQYRPVEGYEVPPPGVVYRPDLYRKHAEEFSPMDDNRIVMHGILMWLESCSQGQFPEGQALANEIKKRLGIEK